MLLDADANTWNYEKHAVNNRKSKISAYIMIYRAKKVVRPKPNHPDRFHRLCAWRTCYQKPKFHLGIFVTWTITCTYDQYEEFTWFPVQNSSSNMNVRVQLAPVKTWVTSPFLVQYLRDLYQSKKQPSFTCLLFPGNEVTCNPRNILYSLISWPQYSKFILARYFRRI